MRSLSLMCSAPYDLFTMLQLGGQPPSAAMMAMNQLTTGSGMAGGAVHHAGGHQHLTATSATVKRRKKSQAAPHPKKMFEEAQMVRRVKAYLANMKVIPPVFLSPFLVEGVFEIDEESRPNCIEMRAINNDTLSVCVCVCACLVSERGRW